MTAQVDQHCLPTLSSYRVLVQQRRAATVQAPVIEAVTH